MNPAQFSTRILLRTLLLSAILAIGFLPGCSTSPEEHARIAKSIAADEKQRAASVEALAASGNRELLTDVAKNAIRASTRLTAAVKLEDQQLLLAIALSARLNEKEVGVFPARRTSFPSADCRTKEN